METYCVCFQTTATQNDHILTYEDQKTFLEHIENKVHACSHVDPIKYHYQCVHSVPDAAVVFEGAGSLLTFQTELDRTWIVFLLQEQSSESM